MTPAEAIELYASIHGGAYNWEMHELLFELERLEHVKTVLEIGCHQGDSLRIWRALWPDATLIGIEPTDEIRAAALELGALAPMHWIKGNSQDESANIQVRQILRYDGQIDFLYIDGDHTLEPLRRDWELYAPLVRPGGLIVLHDAVITWNPSVDVHLFYEELRKTERTKLIWAGGDPGYAYCRSTGAAVIYR